MSNRRYFTEDFKIDIKATPKKVDIKADGDEAKEVEDLARSMFGDDFDFFSAFDEEDKATEEVDEPIDNGFEDEEEVKEEEVEEGEELTESYDDLYVICRQIRHKDPRMYLTDQGYATKGLDRYTMDIYTTDAKKAHIFNSKEEAKDWITNNLFDYKDINNSDGSIWIQSINDSVFKQDLEHSSGISSEELTEDNKIKQYVHYKWVNERGIGPVDASADTIEGLAKQLGMSVGSVKSCISRGDKTFAKVLIDPNDDDSDIDLAAYDARQAAKNNLKECGTLQEGSEIQNAIENFMGDDSLKECGPIEEGSVRTIQDSGFDWGSSHYYLIDDPDTNLTSYHISDGVDKVSKDGIPARKALREILDFIKSHLKNRKDISLVWTDSPKDDGSGDVIVSIYSNWERDGKYPRTLANWSEAERMIRNALHLHNGPMTECGPIEEKCENCEEELELREDAGEQFVIWFAFIANDWDVPKYLGEGQFNGNYDEYYVIDPRKAHRFNSLEEAQTWYDENQDDAFDESEFEEGEYHRVLSTNDPQFKRDVARHNKRDYDKARYANKKTGLREDAGEQFVLWVEEVADDWGVPRYLSETGYSDENSYDAFENWVQDAREAHKFNSVEEAKDWYRENTPEEYSYRDLAVEFAKVLSTNDLQYKKDVAKYNKRDYDKARYAKRKI